MRWLIVFLASPLILSASDAALETARNKQDRSALERLSADRTQAAAQSPKSAPAQYQAALTQSYLSEVALELRDKQKARAAAEAGIAAAKAAIGLDPNKAEYHRVLGTLCGQIIPADTLAALQHGKCAKQEIETALKLDPNSALAWLSSGVGKFYLPPMFGGGLEIAINDFQKAAELDPKMAEAWLWIGLAQRKANKNAEAHASIAKARSLNPDRIWIQQQLEKTPPK